MAAQWDDRLLPGEDPIQIQGGDVEHWISVYEELLAAHRRIRREIGGDGSQPIERYIHRLKVHLAFWKGQLP